MIQIRLAIIVFLSGACVMMLELCGSRILAPMIGSSIFVWTSLIGAILTALSVGYWKGGVLADRGASMKQLSIVLLIASALVAFIPMGADSILLIISRSNLDPRLAALISALALFALPSVAMGMVPPIALRLSVHSLDSAGRAVGLLTACSTLGSIVGTFLLGFFLLARVGTMETVVGIAIVLALTSVLANLSFRTPVKLVLFVAIYMVSQMQRNYSEILAKNGYRDMDTNYQRVSVIDYQSTHAESIALRSLKTGPEGSQTLMDRNDPIRLVADYLLIFELGMWATPHPHTALLIGGGGFSFPKWITRYYPQTHLDIVELDPGITEIAKVLFGFRETTNTKIFHQDARIFLNTHRGTPGQKGKYDAIFLDAYTSAANIPFQLTTKEFYTLLSDTVSEDGVVVINIIASIEGPSSCILRHIYGSTREHFPEMRVYVARPEENPLERQNVVIIARRGKSQGFLPAVKNEELQRRWESNWKKEIPPPPFEFTDNFAPAEHAMVYGC